MSQKQSMPSVRNRFFDVIGEAFRGGERDYTQGSIRQAIVLLAIPMILELSLESIFAVVDMFFVSKLGEAAMTTVGLTESVITIVYSIAIGLSTAATAIVARRIGEKNRDGAGHAGAQAIVLTLLISLVLSVAGTALAPGILHFMGASQEVVSMGTPFTRIMMAGSPVITMLFLINGIFRGAGDAAMAMRSLWIASLLNIFLDPLFIFGIGSWEGFGLQGAAIATTIGRAAGVAYQCYHLMKPEGNFRLKRANFRLDFPVIRTIVNIAWPATFQFIVASGSWIFLAKLVAETGGTEVSAGYQVAIRNIVFFILPAWGLSNAAATLVGQNLGANQLQRAEKSVLLTARYNAVFMAGVMLLFLFFAAPIVRVFAPDGVAHEAGTLALRIIGAGYIFYGIGMVMIQALNGAGDTKTPTIVNLLGFWVLQIPLAYFLGKTLEWGPTGAYVAIPVAETAMAIAAIFLFRKGSWKKVKL